MVNLWTIDEYHVKLCLIWKKFTTISELLTCTPIIEVWLKNLSFYIFFRLGTFGAIIEYGIERKITKQSTLAATMSVGAVGVVLKIRLNRASQTYNFPIHLSDEILFQPLFYGTVTPMIAWYVLKKLILEPWEAKESKKVEKQHKMEENAR